MPYITSSSRQKYNILIDELTEKIEKSGSKPGDINYCFSRLIWSLFIKAPSYTLANTLIGVLECMKLEFYRRHVADYENKKIEENGDIFDIT